MPCDIFGRKVLSYLYVCFTDGSLCCNEDDKGLGTLYGYGTHIALHNKDCTLFDEKIEGRYFLLHRPSSPEIGGNYIWLAESEDLLHWGNHQCVATTRPEMWDSARIGAGAAPIKTEKGMVGYLSWCGPVSVIVIVWEDFLLSLSEPSKVLARSKDPLMVPEADYEKVGFFSDVIFTNGHVVDGDTITIYYGV